MLDELELPAAGPELPEFDADIPVAASGRPPVLFDEAPEPPEVELELLAPELEPGEPQTPLSEEFSDEDEQAANAATEAASKGRKRALMIRESGHRPPLATQLSAEVARMRPLRDGSMRVDCDDVILYARGDFTSSRGSVLE